MYFDKIFNAEKTLPSVSYTDILQDELNCVEIEGKGQMYLMMSEVKSSFLGSEAEEDEEASKEKKDSFWKKIKVVARKIFEMAKTLGTKVIVFITSIPTRISTLVNKIIGKIGALHLKMRKEISDADKNGKIDIPAETLKKISETTLPNYLSASEDETKGNIYDAILKHIATALKEIESGDIESKTVASVKEEVKKFSEATKKDIAYKGSITKEVIIKQMDRIYGELKNHADQKFAETATKPSKELGSKISAAITKAYGDIDKAASSNDETAARKVIDTLKALRMLYSQLAKVNVKVSNVVAKRVNASQRLYFAMYNALKSGMGKKQEEKKEETK